MEIATEAKDWPAVELNADRMLAVNPLVPAPHRALAQAAEALDKAETAIAARQALLVLDTSDPAQSHYQLAKLLADQGELAQAKRHVLSDGRAPVSALCSDCCWRSSTARTRRSHA